MTLPQTWLDSVYAQHYFACERPYLQNALRQATGPAVLQVGRLLDSQPIRAIDLPLLIQSASVDSEQADLLCDAAFLPFPEKSLSSVVLPHVLERHELPHQVLREAHRILQSDGHLVLTGFNPFSLLGLQRKLRATATLSGKYYTTGRVIDWLQLLGFEVISTTMYHHAPLSKRPPSRKIFTFFESVGHRWLPLFGGAYMIIAKKREVGMTLLGGSKYSSKKAKLATAAPAKTSLKYK